MSIDMDAIREAVAGTVNDALKDHMKSCVYTMNCTECGEDLDYDVDVDSDMELQIKVTPCKCGEKE